MTIGTYCTHWEAPTLPEQMKCRHRILAGETPAYKGKPICVNPNRSRFECCKEHEYSIRISADISQELPGYTCEHCGDTLNNNYPCSCRAERMNMGAPIPQIQPVANVIASLNAEVEELTQSLTDGNRAINDFNAATRIWQEQYIGEPQVEYRNQINGSWNMESQHIPPDDLESMNPINCTNFDANEFGNCKNLSWCFRVFGIQLQCQQTRKEVIPKPLKEHRRLEVE